MFRWKEGDSSVKRFHCRRHVHLFKFLCVYKTSIILPLSSNIKCCRTLFGKHTHFCDKCKYHLKDFAFTHQNNTHAMFHVVTFQISNIRKVSITMTCCHFFQYFGKSFALYFDEVSLFLSNLFIPLKDPRTKW